MAANQRSQQEAFQELTRASRDKANDEMFTQIKIFNGTNSQVFEDWIDEVNQVCRASNRDFRTELFKKSAGAVKQVVLSCDEFTDDELVTKLRSCFSHAPTMNEAREELQNMRQMEHESVSVYMYRWGRALYWSSGIWPNNERHPHVIKDFISSLKKNIRNKIANRWAEMQHAPSTIKKALELASNVEKQLQVADSFKLEFHPMNSMKWAWSKHLEMKWNSMRCQEVRNGEIISIITATGIPVLATVTATTTNNNRIDLKTTDKAKMRKTISNTLRSFLSEKLDSIRNMPKPRSPKEIKQFLGLTSYYRKFVPRFSDMARPLTKLLAHDCKFEWTKQCDISFQMLKDTLCLVPILKYPDTSKLYMLYTDTSKYGWAGVLTQSHTSTVDGKSIIMDHPMSYVSGLFHGSQLNWAALTKEAYAIYMSIKNLLFTLQDIKSPWEVTIYHSRSFWGRWHLITW